MQLPKQKELIYRSNWGILIILDACRYDIFKECIRNLGVPYELKKVESAGSCTMEWFINTFDKPIPNTIYISGNPFIGPYMGMFNDIQYDPRKIFDSVRPAYMDTWRPVNGVYCIDPFYLTMKAKPVLFIKIHKRVIIHYMQPHAPYPLTPELKDYFVNAKTNSDFKLWQALKNGELEREQIINAYRKNLEWVLDEIKEIIRFYRHRKIVITSDHGELFGEHDLYGHPCGKRVRELIEVPWCEIKP